MADNQPQPTGSGEPAEPLAPPPGWSRAKALERRWGYLTTHATSRQIFELLGQEPGRQMYLAEIAATLGKSVEFVRQSIRHLRLAKIVGEEKRAFRVYVWLRPGMVAQYQEYLDSREPMHLRVFVLLFERGEMYETQMADALHVSTHMLQQGIARLQEVEFVVQEYRQGGYGRKFYRIRPGMADQYRQWLDSQKPDEPQP